ncbi:hypothetical protein [Sphingobacterium thalpophilum]|uniref:hypothetical protein n=1 Tax=Sphingobacterium thalpophilum TaxID=259 RepID=UPI0024A641BD|nr:hypothetical protein [Sphingobacterium thalpophilum]
MKPFLYSVLGKSSDSWTRLPLFIKIFSFYFLLSGPVVLVLSVCQLFGIEGTIRIYGLESQSPITVVGALVLIIYILKFFVAYGFYKGIGFTRHLAIFEATFGVLIGLFVVFGPMYLDQPVVPHNLSLDLFFLIPYLLILFARTFEPHKHIVAG